MDLKALVLDDSVTVEAIAERLDSASPQERLESAHSLDRNGQRALYRKAASSRPITLDDFVPSDRPSLETVRHRGRNTLPMPRPLQLFEKRFCRPENRAECLFGYNQSPFIKTVGPGFFVAVGTSGNPTWKERGAVVVDYFQIPDGKVAPDWPPVIPNTQGLQKYVYHRTRDFMRRVSNHVSIGAAFKVEKMLDHYFVLVREP